MEDGMKMNSEDRGPFMAAVLGLVLHEMPDTLSSKELIGMLYSIIKKYELDQAQSAIILAGLTEMLAKKDIPPIPEMPSRKMLVKMKADILARQKPQNPKEYH